MIDSVKEMTGVDLNEMSYEEALKVAKENGLDTDGLINWGKVVEAMYEHKVEHTLVQPTFVCDFPVEISPLAKKHRKNERLTERFELFIHGMEIANAYTELNDPDLQQKLFETQLEGMPEEDSMARMDHDFVRALRNGMPPAGGLGLGIDRLIMLMSGANSIRDVMAFPKTQSAACPLTSAPAEVSTKQLRELNLKLRKVETKSEPETGS